MRRLIAVLLCLALIVVGVCAPLLYRADRELVSAVREIKGAVAVVNYDATARCCKKGLSWSTPGLSSSEEVIALCGDVLRAAPEQSQLSMLEGVFEGLSSSRSAFVSQSHKDLFELAHGELVKRRGVPVLSDPKAATTVDFQMQMVAQAFFWAWILLTAWTLWSGVTAEGRVKGGAMIRRGVFAAAAYVGWLWALCGRCQ
jgi:hypothetical protein